MSRNGTTVMDPIAREQARQAAALTTMGPAFKVIDMGLLVESPLNTRKHFDQAKLADLRQSIAESGILTPMLVRPNARVAPKGMGMVYEIAAGHRRFRAAQLAGVTAAPCVVREMDDATFLEVLTIENLQREDVHPLEEAQGYRHLLAQDGYDIARLAKRVGKSESYVYDRMALLRLTPPAQKLFFAQRFTLGHAILLARLSPADQARCLATPDGGMWRRSYGGHPVLGLEDPSGLHAESVKPASLSELQAWIDNHVRFTKPDESTPHLFPDTAANLAAADDAKAKVIEISRDHQIKEDAKHPDGKRTYCTTSWERADGKPEANSWGKLEETKTCDHSVLGVVVAGRGRGESFLVCIDKKRCTTHWAKEIKERNRRERERDSSGAPTKAAPAKAQRTDPNVERARKRWEKGGDVVMKAIAAKLKQASVDSTGPVGTACWALYEDGIWGMDGYAKDAARFGIARGKTAADLLRHIAMCDIVSVAHDAAGSVYGEGDIQERVNRLKLKVNVKQLLDAANPEPTAKPKATAKKAAPKTKAKAKARASK